jgi:hypothetical protein
MANLFLYTGTTFLRENGGQRSGTSGEAQFAYQNYLPFGGQMAWQTVHNIDPETCGTRKEGNRRFRYVKNSPPFMGLRLHTVLSSASINKSAGQYKQEGNASTLTEKVTFTRGELGKDKDVSVDNSSGRIPRKQADALVDDIIQCADLNGRFLGVGDCNSFHNAAYLFGALALHGKPTPALIVNVDQHTDIGIGTLDKGIVSSDGWAMSLLDRLGAGAYLCLGSGGKTEGSQQNMCMLKPRGAAIRGWSQLKPLVPKITKEELTDNNAQALQTKLVTLLQTLRTQLQEDFASVYITIDRDCMLGNYTQWGEIGAIIDGYPGVLRILTALKGALATAAPQADLAGMDATGLPEEGCGPGNGGFQYQNIRAELQAYRQFLDAW